MLSVLMNTTIANAKIPPINQKVSEAARSTKLKFSMRVSFELRWE